MSDAVFGAYAKYYDLLYKDKNYNEETGFIVNTIKEHQPNAKTILELGCGSGKHAKLFNNAGYVVHGIDMSPEMVEQANILAKDMNDCEFEVSDIREFECDKQFDVVMSLFHVMSYQTTNKDLKKAFGTAAKHLKKGGLFIFDCWYGPGVLTEPPSVRVKRLESDDVEIMRLAEPEIYAEKNCVDVNYTVQIKDKKTGEQEEIKESHKMRYLFNPEILMIFEDLGLEFVKSSNWLSDEPLTFESWIGYFVARKI